jgi:hypothetical protein
MTCEYAGTPFSEPRSHPWVDAEGSPECRYYDLTSAPEHVRTSLEDFLPFGQHAAIEDFYALLTWLNRPESVLESNDCAFTGPEANENLAFDKSLECSGRLMVLFRELERNTIPGHVERLSIELHQHLAGLDPELLRGVEGTTPGPERYLALSAGGGGQHGDQMMLSFWAWGDTEAETMLNLARSLGNLAQALRALTAQPGMGPGWNRSRS